MTQEIDGPEEKAKSWFGQISRWPIIAGMIALATALGAAITLYDRIQEATERASSLLSVPEVIGFALSKNATGMADEYLVSGHDGPGIWEFMPDPRTFERRVPIFTFTLSNPSKESVVFTEVIYDVLRIGTLRSLVSGPLDPLTTYVHEIEHRIGTQRKKLSPPFVVAANSAASLDIQWISLAESPNQYLDMKVGFVSQGHIAITPRFRVRIPKGYSRDQ